jgi:hypothetical protein
MRQFSGVKFESLGRPRKPRLGANMRCDAGQRRTKCVTWNGNENVTALSERTLEIKLYIESRWEYSVR